MPCREELNKSVFSGTSCSSQDLAAWLEVLLGFFKGKQKMDLQRLCCQQLDAG